MHKCVVTSDPRRQVLSMRKQAKEVMEKKQAEENERLRKLNEVRCPASTLIFSSMVSTLRAISMFWYVIKYTVALCPQKKDKGSSVDTENEDLRLKAQKVTVYLNALSLFPHIVLGTTSLLSSYLKRLFRLAVNYL